MSLSNNSTPPTQVSWFSLNADGVFVAWLIIAAGLIDFFTATANPIVQAGHPEEVILVQFRSAGYVAAGVLLLWSLVSSKIVQEVVGRCLFLGAVAFQIWRRLIEFDFFDLPVLSVVILFLIYAVASWMRLHVLLAKEGAIFFIPPRRKDRR
jgi:hypothetical protein